MLLQKIAVDSHFSGLAPFPNLQREKGSIFRTQANKIFHFRRQLLSNLIHFNHFAASKMSTKRKNEKNISDFFSPKPTKKTKAATEEKPEETSEQKEKAKKVEKNAEQAEKKEEISEEKKGDDSKLSPIAKSLTEPGWQKLLLPEMQKPYFKKIEMFVEAARKKGPVWPKTEDTFTAFNETPLKDVKVVVIGQDPYFNANQGHGLCFSVNKGIKTPPSLNRMYKELESCYPGYKKPNHGYLLEWAQRGVLLLNATLTVNQGAANSHAKCGWQDFTDAVIKLINKHCDGLVILLWGGFAKKKGKIVDRKKHHVLECAHPSPLSGNKWFGNKTFLEANNILKKLGKDPIDWSISP